MTYATLKKAGLATLTAFVITATLPAASAMAADGPVDNFTVQKTTDGRIKLGVKSFKKGEYERSVRFTRSALKTSLSSRKASIAHSNLCAAYAKLEMMEEAVTACNTALEIRPDYEIAQANKAALTIRLAQK